MEIVLDKKDTTNASIKIKLNEADYQPKVTEKLKEYGKKAAIKGFRPGKVPPTLLKKMFGKSILIEEINQMLVKSVNEYIKENQLPIVGDPLPEKEEATTINWDTQKEFEFSYSVGLVPEFTYDLDALSLTEYEVEVTQEQVEQAISNLRKRHGEYTHPDISDEEDFIIGDLKAKEGEFFKEKVFLSLNRVQPAVRPEFIGKAKGDTIAFDIQNTLEKPEQVSFLTGTSKEEAEKLTGTFELTVTDIERLQEAQLNKEFFDKVLPRENVETEEAFRDKMRENLQQIYHRDAKYLLGEQVRKQLIENTAIELPDEFLKRWLKETNEKVTDEQITNEYDDFAKALKWDVIKNKVAKDAELKVDHVHVVQKTKEMLAEQFGMTVMDLDDERWDAIANQYLKAENGKNYMNIFNQVFADKVTEYITGKAPAQKQTVTPEALRELAQE